MDYTCEEGKLATRQVTMANASPNTIQTQPSTRSMFPAEKAPNPDHAASFTITPPVASIPLWRLVSLYVSVCLGLFLGFLDTSIVSTALYTIGMEFQALSQTNWVPLAYTLAYLGCTAIFASLSDVFGRRNAYTAAFVIFLAFSLACGWAQNINQLIVFRALQGIGGSGLYSIGFIILPEISSIRMLKMIGALAGGVIAMSGVLGPVLGGIITEYTTWRWVFWINAPIGICPLILFFLAWPNEKQLKPSERRPIRQMDIVGFLLLLAASLLFIFAFQEAGIHVITNNHVWKTAIFVAPLIVGIICWILLVFWEWTISARWSSSINALFPLRLAKPRVYVCAVAATMLIGFPYFVIIYSLPIYLQVVNERSALASGIALLPMLGASAFGSTIAGAISSKKNRFFPSMVTGAILMLIGTATLTTLENTPHTQPKVYGLQIFTGLGFGLTASTSTMLASLESELRDNAVAQGIMAQVRVFGGSLGIAVSTVILGAKERERLIETRLVAPFQIESLRTAIMELSPESVHTVRQVYTDAFDKTLMVCAIMTALCLVVSIGCWQKDPIGMEERRKQQIQDEALRQNALAQGKTAHNSVTSGKGEVSNV